MHRRWSIAIATVVALVGIVPATSAQAAQGAPPQAMGWYLALGDSLAAGYQPGQGDDLTGGYVGGVLDAVKDDTPKTKLVNVACSGETVVTMVNGGRCSYDEGTQLAEALHFLKAHGKFTRLVTIDIGANDVQRCVSRSPLGVDFACVQSGLDDVATLLPAALQQIRAAAPDAEIVVANYYNPFLAAYLAGPSGQVLAAQSVLLQAQLNGIIAAAASSVGAELADVATAFKSTDTTPVALPGVGPVPTNVATICTWTWMCQLTDIHANDTGYAVMAATVAGRL